MTLCKKHGPGIAFVMPQGSEVPAEPLIERAKLLLGAEVVVIFLNITSGDSAFDPSPNAGKEQIH